MRVKKKKLRNSFWAIRYIVVLQWFPIHTYYYNTRMYLRLTSEYYCAGPLLYDARRGTAICVWNYWPNYVNHFHCSVINANHTNYHNIPTIVIVLLYVIWMIKNNNNNNHFNIFIHLIYIIMHYIHIICTTYNVQLYLYIYFQNTFRWKWKKIKLFCQKMCPLL